MLSRTQPRPPESPHATLAELQDPIIDAYLAALPPGRAPRIVGSRSVFVAESRAEALRLADIGLRTAVRRFIEQGSPLPGDTLADLIKAFDVHVGTPEDVIASLRADKTLARVTDLAVQVHSIDPPHPLDPAVDRTGGAGGGAGVRLAAGWQTKPNRPRWRRSHERARMSSTRWPAWRRARRWR